MPKCKNEARFRYTWPGKDEATICFKHVFKLQSIANAMGLHIQITPLSEKDALLGLECQQEINKSENR